MPKLINLINLLIENRKVFFFSIFISLAIVESFFVAQVIFILKHFKPQYAVVPTLLGLTIGLLLGSVLVLRRQLSQQADILHAIADQAFEFSFYRKPSGEFIYLSPAVEELTGYKVQDFYQNHHLLKECIHPEDLPVWNYHLEEVKEHHVHKPLLIRIIHKNGQRRWIRHVCSSIKDENGVVVGVRSTNADVTEEVTVKKEIEHLVNYDPLTDLPNRRRLTQHIDNLISSPTEQDLSLFAVLFVDLDRFKYINDTYGHSFGDKFLRLIAERLIQQCENNELVARFGGDEFVIVLPRFEQPEVALEFAKKIINSLEEAIEIQDKKLYVSASIGIAVFPFDGQDADTLIKHADVAMYQSKDKGSGTIQFASSELTNQASQVLTLETRIRQGIENNEFKLFYQPKVSIPDQTIIGYEALARWQTSDGDIISPAAFIPLAEETGLIIPIAASLMKQLQQQVAIWIKEDKEYHVAFNLSARQLNDSACCHRIVSGWVDAGLPLEALEIEVTESMIMENFEQVLSQLVYLREHGVKVSLDDFGTGYSSLGYLRDLPIDTLKIDRTFVNNLHTSKQDQGIIKAISTLAENFSMNVIAEGVEIEEQMHLLHTLGCHQAQGYFFGKPISPDNY